MRIELLKNKKTQTIDKLSIDYGDRNEVSDVPYKLTHEESMTFLDAKALKEHEMIMNFATPDGATKGQLMKYFHDEYHNKAVDNLIIKLIETSIEYKLIDNEKDVFDFWFLKYYVWAEIFALVTKGKISSKETDGYRMVNPMVLLTSSGIRFLNNFKVMDKPTMDAIKLTYGYDFKKSEQIISEIIYKTNL